MTVHDWVLIIVAAIVMLPFVGTLAWGIYQFVALKKDVDLLSMIKELEQLYEAIHNILGALGVDTVDQAVNEIRVLKGTVPAPSDEDQANLMFQNEDGQMINDPEKGSVWVPFAKPASKK